MKNTTEAGHSHMHAASAPKNAAKAVNRLFIKSADHSRTASAPVSTRCALFPVLSC